MERRPKRQSSANIDYRVRIRPVREPKLKIIHQGTAPSTSQDSNYGNNRKIMDEGDIDSDHVKSDCVHLLDAINQLQDPDDGTYLNSLFLELPSKELYKDYYQLIKKPIALDMITNKVNKNKYMSLDDMKSDLQLMIANAKEYNMEASQVYQDALEIQKLIKSWTHGSRKRRNSRSSLHTAEKKSPAPSKNVLKLPGGAFSARRNSSDNDDNRGRIIRIKTGSKNLKPLMTSIENEDKDGALEILTNDPHINPNQLVEVDLFDDTFTWSPLHAACYYGLIDVCEALLSRGANVELNDTWYSATPLGWAAYGDHEDIARLLIGKYNARKDAKNIHEQDPFDLVPEQDDPKWNGIFVNMNSASSKGVITHQQQQPQQKKHQLIIQHHDPNKKRRGRPLKSEIESKRAAQRPIHRIDLATFDVGSFLIDIFNSIRKNSDNTHRVYSELFEKLPNREEYADYYKVIKNPISLGMIEDKMRGNNYKTVQEWFDDLTHVFENAMEYNENGSRIYKDGKLLLRMLNRVKEKLIFDYGMPDYQEPELMALDLTDRPFDLTGLRSKRQAARASEQRHFDSHGANFNMGMNPLQQQALQSHNQLHPHYHHPHQSHQQVPQQSHHLHQQPVHIKPQQHPYQQHPHHQKIRPHDQFLRDQMQHIAPSPSPPFPMTPMQAGLPFTNPGSFNPQQQLPGFMPMTPPGMMMMNGNHGMAHQQQASVTTPPVLHQALMAPSPRPALPHNGSSSPSSVLPASPSITTIPNGTPPHQAYFNLMAAQQMNHPPAVIARDIQPPPLSNQSISHVDAEFMELINKDSSEVRLLDSLTLSSDDKTFFMNLDGKQVGHSIVIPAHVATVELIPKLPMAMDKELSRVTIQVIHNTNNLSPQQQATPPSWSTGLARGMNVFKLIIMINATTPTSIHADYRTQTYHLFVNHIS